MAEPLTIYERTLVRTVEEHTIFTGQATVTANHIVFASHFPFVNFPGLYFARIHQERSYVLALSHAQKLDGIYYGMDTDGLSFRNVGDLLLLGGSGAPDRGELQGRPVRSSPLRRREILAQLL